MKLKANQNCPIPGHGRNCPCPRKEARTVAIKSRKWETVRAGWRRTPDKDATITGGYRYLLSAAAMRKVLDRKIQDQDGICGLGGESFTNYEDIVPEHIEPKGLNGSKRNDHPNNIQAACSLHNLEKGSMSMTQWREYRKEKGLPYVASNN